MSRRRNGRRRSNRRRGGRHNGRSGLAEGRTNLSITADEFDFDFDSDDDASSSVPFNQLSLQLSQPNPSRPSRGRSRDSHSRSRPPRPPPPPATAPAPSSTFDFAAHLASLAAGGSGGPSASVSPPIDAMMPASHAQGRFQDDSDDDDFDPLAGDISTPDSSHDRDRVSEGIRRSSRKVFDPANSMDRALAEMMGDSNDSFGMMMMGGEDDAIGLQRTTGTHSLTSHSIFPSQQVPDSNDISSDGLGLGLGGDLSDIMQFADDFEDEESQDFETEEITTTATTYNPSTHLLNLDDLEFDSIRDSLRDTQTTLPLSHTAVPTDEIETTALPHPTDSFDTMMDLQAEMELGLQMGFGLSDDEMEEEEEEVHTDEIPHDDIQTESDYFDHQPQQPQQRFIGEYKDVATLNRQQQDSSDEFMGIGIGMGMGFEMDDDETIQDLLRMQQQDEEEEVVRLGSFGGSAVGNKPLHTIDSVEVEDQVLQPIPVPTVIAGNDNDNGLLPFSQERNDDWNDPIVNPFPFPSSSGTTSQKLPEMDLDAFLVDDDFEDFEEEDDDGVIGVGMSVVLKEPSKPPPPPITTTTTTTITKQQPPAPATTTTTDISVIPFSDTRIKKSEEEVEGEGEEEKEEVERRHSRRRSSRRRRLRRRDSRRRRIRIRRRSHHRRRESRRRRRRRRRTRKDDNRETERRRRRTISSSRSRSRRHPYSSEEEEDEERFLTDDSDDYSTATDDDDDDDYFTSDDSESVEEDNDDDDEMFLTEDDQKRNKENLLFTKTPYSRYLDRTSRSNRLKIPRSEQFLSTLIHPSLLSRHTTHHESMLKSNMVFKMQLDVIRARIQQNNAELLHQVMQNCGVEYSEPILDHEVLKAKLKEMLAMQQKRLVERSRSGGDSKLKLRS